MVKLTTILFPLYRAPTTLTVQSDNSKNILYYLTNCFNVRYNYTTFPLVTTETKIGTFFSLHPKVLEHYPDLNVNSALVSRLLRDHALEDAKRFSINGPCILAFKKKKTFHNIPVETIKGIQQLYSESFRFIFESGIKFADEPPKAKSERHLFLANFYEQHKGKVPELSKEANEKWAALTPEEKAPYSKLAEQKQSEYRRAVEQWQSNTPKVPQKPRLAHILYKDAMGKDAKPWSELADDDKKRKEYVAKYQALLARYEQDIVVFRQFCSDTAQDFDTLVGKFPIRTPVEGSAVTPTTSTKRRTKSTTSPTESSEAPKPKRKRGTSTAPKEGNPVRAKSTGRSKKVVAATDGDKPAPKRRRKNVTDPNATPAAVVAV